MSMIKKLIFVEKAVFPSFPQQRSFCSVLPSQEIKSLPRHCRNNHLFQQSLHLILRYTIRTKYTQKFCLFHIYGDVYALLITFMGTWMSSKFIIFTSNSDSNSTKWKCRQNIYLWSKQPIVQKKFALSSLISYDTHKVYTEISSFSPLWGHFCPFNHLYGNVNVF